jgi:peptidyl-prolyl cis-trans isomerase C
VVARVDDTEIRRSDLLIAQMLLPESYRKLPLEAIYPLVLGQVIDNTLFVRAARAEGLDDSAVLRQRLAAIEKRLLEGAYVQRAVRGKVTDYAMRERYRIVTDRLRGQEELRVRHILVKSRREAETILRKLSDGADFAELAREHSLGPSKSRGGDLGYMARAGMVEPFADAAFGLKTGEVTPMPILTRFGWHVIKLEARRAMKIPPYEEMRPQLAREIRVKIAADLAANLRRRAAIVEYDINGEKAPESASRTD